MKSKEFEIKKRDPNWRAMQDIRRSGAGGQHKDKKKAEKQGDVKHKGKEISENADELYGLRIGDTVSTEFNGQMVQGDVIDLFLDDMEVELLLRGPETGRTVVVDVRDTEIVEATGDEKFDAMMRTIKKGTKKQATADRREREAESRKRARDAFGPSPADKLSIRKTEEQTDEVFAYSPAGSSMSRTQSPRRKSSSMLSIMRAMKDKEQRDAVKTDKDQSKDKTKVKIESSDWGEPREILEDVLQTLEREVEWPLTEVMDPREVRQLLSPIVRAVNDKLLSMEKSQEDESVETNLETRIDELKRGTGFLILKFREKELPEGEGKYLIGYGGFGETPDDVRLANAVVKEFKAEKFEDMRRKIFDLFKDKSFVGVEKIKINAPTSLIGKYPELEKLFSAAESGEFKKVEPIFSEPKEKISKKTEKYRIDPVTGKREKIKEPIKYGRGMSGRPGEPGEPTVRFSITNPRLASMMKDQGMQFNQGKFTVSQSMYKKLLDALRDAEMVRKFGDVTSLIKDKEIIENHEAV